MGNKMRILGLFALVFSGFAVASIVGFSDIAISIGAVTGAGTYIILTEKRGA